MMTSSEREQQKAISLMSKNNGSARPARAYHILVHFFAVVSLTNDDCNDNAKTQCYHFTRGKVILLYVRHALWQI